MNTMQYDHLRFHTAYRHNQLLAEAANDRLAALALAGRRPVAMSPWLRLPGLAWFLAGLRQSPASSRG